MVGTRTSVLRVYGVGSRGHRCILVTEVTAVRKTIICSETLQLPTGPQLENARFPSVFWTVRDIAAVGPDAEDLGGPRLKVQNRPRYERPLLVGSISTIYPRNVLL
jgi:hypothetical protein